MTGPSPIGSCRADGRLPQSADGPLIGLDACPEALRHARSLDVADTLIEADLRDPLATYRVVVFATGGRLADVTVVTSNVAAARATRSQDPILQHGDVLHCRGSDGRGPWDAMSR